MKSLILFSLITFSFAAPGLLGTKECTYGPSYWCSHISKAQKCGAVQHCKTTVWKNQIIKPKDTVECNFCKIGIEEVRNMLKKNGTEEKILEYLNELCNMLPNPDMKEDCQTTVFTYLPVVLSLIKDSNMTAEQVCATMQLCTGYEDTVPHPGVPIKQEVKVNANDVCNDCTVFFQDIHDIVVSNETVKQIEDELKQTICSQLGSVEGMCDFVVDEYVPQILQYLGQTIDPQTTCRVLGLCSNKGDLFTALRIRMQFTQLFKQFNKVAIGGTEECAVCKSVITNLQALDRDVTTQDKVKDFVKTELCKRLGELTDECNNLVDQYSSVVFELLANELDPDTVCSFIGFCRTSLVKTQKMPIVALTLVSATPIKTSKPVKTSGPYCAVCKLAMNYLDSMLEKNATKEQIEAALDQVCSRLPGDLAAECKSFVDQYAPAIIALLEQELDPTAVCDKLGLCTPLSSQKNSKTVKSSLECVLCEFVMSEVENLIAANKSKAAVEAALDKVCSLMPSTISQECTDFVNMYADVIINLLIQEVQPAAVCRIIGLCKGAVKTLPKPVTGILLRGEPIVTQKKPVKDAETCLVCETVLNYVAEALKENKTAAAIKALLEKACTVLPASMAEECQGLVIAFGDEIIQMLQQELDPKQICTELGLCTATKVKVLDEIKAVLLERQNKNDNKLYFKPKTNNKLGQKKCSYGPDYWCKSTETAKECGMVEHCQTHVWSKNKD